MSKFQIYGKVNIRIDDLRMLPLLKDDICADEVNFEQGFVKFISQKDIIEHHCVYAISTDYVGLVKKSDVEPKNAGWIAMTEKKPEDGQYVLVCHSALDYGRGMAYFYSRDGDDVFYAPGCNVPLKYAEWWMPLPPSPEGFLR